MGRVQSIMGRRAKIRKSKQRHEQPMWDGGSHFGMAAPTGGMGAAIKGMGATIEGMGAATEKWT